jgi:Tetratricopeptide repeat/NB-ARC domain
MVLLTNLIGLPHPCFMVPYERNQYFKGRDAFLKQIYLRFRDSKIPCYQGRLALYGLGGIGKTQTALEYVYRYQASYDRIYWISAVSQESLLDGYAKIAKRAEIPIPPESKPIEIVERVLSWLKQDQNWLLLIDNLDDINILSTHNLRGENVIETLLPQSGPQQHTLITTRNPHADNIPAQGIEVPLFDKTEAIELLTSVSDIFPPSNSSENEAAEKIIEELGRLPLAIRQAAAYVKLVAGNFTRFLKRYKEYRIKVNGWMSEGQQYPHSVAKTWALSFDAVFTTNPAAAALFRLLAFLNPDGILIDFLRSGASALRDDLRRLLSQEIEMEAALLRLETFSLLQWNRPNKTLVVHRLVQAVVKDEMSRTELMAFRGMTVDICDQSFPQEWNNETRALCRCYVGQVMGPLIDPEASETEKSANVMARLGLFLGDDGKVIDSERVLEKSLKICTRILGAEHPATLTSMNNLANTYSDQGRTGEAAALEKQWQSARTNRRGEEN